MYGQVKKHWKKIAVGGAVVAAGIVGDVVIQPAPVAIPVTSAVTEIGWVEPTTDQGWAAESVTEGIDVRGTQTLNDMLAQQNLTYQGVLTDNDQAINCLPCLQYGLRKGLSAQGLTGTDLDTAVNTQAQQQQNDAIAKVGRQEQIILSIENELRLRASGAVVTDQAAPVLGGVLKGAAIAVRHIIKGDH